MSDAPPPRNTEPRPGGLAAAPTAAPMQPLRVWDLPTRLFHWVLAATVLCSVVSAKTGAMVWHFRFGYLVLALLAFRLVWGLVGGRWSRFGSFIFSPRTLLAYLRGRHPQTERLDIGHNPLGALSVFGLLGILLLQVATGLVADDEVANVGPLNRFVPMDAAASATGWHNTWGQWIILGMVGLHIAAIAFYLGFKRRNLIGPMVRGDKLLPPDLANSSPASDDGPRRRTIALLLALAALALAWWVSRFAA